MALSHVLRAEALGQALSEEQSSVCLEGALSGHGTEKISTHRGVTFVIGESLGFLSGDLRRAAD